jgi:putative PEP-CTERM system TPR-repeat lipoprotein
MFPRRFFCGLIAAAALTACGPPSTEELLAEAQTALAEREPRTAEIHLKNLLEREPDHVVARTLLGELLVNTGDAAGAEFNLERALELGADPATVELPLLRALLSQGKFPAVLERIAAGTAVLSGADEIMRRNIKGAAHRALGEFEAAETTYRAALALDPQAVTTRIELASLYVDSGRYAEARPIAAEVLAAQSDYLPAVLLLGRIDSVEGRVVDAERWFEQGAQLARTTGASTDYIAAIQQLIEVQLTQGKVDEASGNVDTLLAFDSVGPAARYLKARIEVEQGNLDVAEQGLERVVADAPEFWPAYALLGRINAAQNQLGQAAMYLRTAFNNNPSDAGVRLMLAEMYLRQNNLEGARELFKGSEGLTVPEGIVMALAGRSSLQAGQPSLAAEFFERSEQSPPANLRELLELSSIYVTAGELDRAVRVLESSSFDLPESEQLISYVLTLVQLRRGDVTAAAATAARLAEQREPSAWLSTLRGSIAALAKDFPGARAFFGEALTLERDHVPALLGLARVALAEDNAGEAAEHLHRVLEVEPQHVNAILGLAELAIARGDFTEGSSWLASTPESPQRFRVQGDLEFERQDYAAAAAAYRRGFALAPSADLAIRIYDSARRAGEQDPLATLSAYATDFPRDPRANSALGSIALENGDHDGAIARYEAVLAVDPRNAPALNNLAWILSERGDERALEFATRAREVSPSDPSIADTLGWLHIRRGEAAAGLPLLEEAVRANPDHPEIRYHWAVALAETGNGARAGAVLEDLLGVNAEFPSRAAAEERLSQLRASRPR